MSTKSQRYYVYSFNGWHIVKRIPKGRKGCGPFINVEQARRWIEAFENGL